MTRYIHISQENPEVGRGGVAQFGRDLKLAVPELEFMYGGSDWAMAEANNLDRLERGLLDSDCVVIADGYYGGGLSGRVKELIVVAHGTYGGWLRDIQRRWLPEFDGSVQWLLEKARAQEKVFHESDRIIAVSTLAQEELWTIHRAESKVVFLGVDADLYSPADEPRMTVCCVCGKDKLKGYDIVSRIAEKSHAIIHQLGFDGPKHKRWKNFYTALLPSRHEGGGYALLEAMSTGLKIVSGRTGYLVYDVPEKYVWASDDYYWGTFNKMLGHVNARSLEKCCAREWILENATLDIFCKKWQEVLNV